MKLSQTNRQITKQEQQLELREKIESGFEEIADVFKNTVEDNYAVIIPEITRIISNEKDDTFFSPKFKKGLEYALEKHIGKYRDGGLSEAVHSIQTSFLTATWNRPIYTIISALLHDVIEENEQDEQEIMNYTKSNFGLHVAEILQGLSTHEKNIEIRDDNHIKKIIKTAQQTQDREILYIKTADVINNLYTKKDMSAKNGLTASERQKKYSENALNNILPIAKYLDKQNEIDLNLESYIIDLAKR